MLASSFFPRVAEPFPHRGMIQARRTSVTVLRRKRHRQRLSTCQTPSLTEAVIALAVAVHLVKSLTFCCRGVFGKTLHSSKR